MGEILVSEEGEYRNRNYPAPKEPTPEDLRAEIERLKSRVDRLERVRDMDEPAIEHAAWEERQRRYGMIAFLVIFPFLMLYLVCGRK